MNSHDKAYIFEPMLKLTAAYFLLVGIALFLFPSQLVERLVGESPSPLVAWRWLGGIIAAYGFGLILGAKRPTRNWRLLFVGFLSMALIILSALGSLWSGGIEPALAWSVIGANLIPLVPISLILMRIASEPAGETPMTPLPDNLNLDRYVTQDGRTLASLSNESPVLLVLLRHLGCTFCRETLADLAARRREIESAGARIVFVHMGVDEQAKYLFERYRLEDLSRISDPEATLYRALGLPRASLLQVYGPGMWQHVIQSVLLDGHGMGQIVGDRFQMPGAFLIHHEAVVGGFRHQRISDHPDYISIVRCAAPASTEDMHY